jgi:hypothetical protein
MNERNYKHGFTQRTAINTDIQRVREINKALISESYTTTIKTIDKAVNLQTAINDKDEAIRKAKRTIIDNVLKLDNSNDESTTNDAEQVIRTILSKYPNLSGYVSHIRQELR